MFAYQLHLPVACRILFTILRLFNLVRCSILRQTDYGSLVALVLYGHYTAGDRHVKHKFRVSTEHSIAL